MSFMTGRTRDVDNSPRDTRETRRNVGSFINGGRGIERIFMGLDDPYTNGLMEQILAPYQAMFDTQRNETFAAAREGAGNLTGSSYGNILGRAAGNVATTQGAQLADIRQRISAQNAQNFLSLVLGFQNSGVPMQQQYEPGFLDYAMQGIGAAAPIFGMFGGRGSASTGAGVGGGTRVNYAPGVGMP